MSFIHNINERSEENLEDLKQCIFLPFELGKKKFIFPSINDNTKIQYVWSGSLWTLNIIEVENKLIFYLDSNNGNVDNSYIFHKRIE